MDKAHTLEAIQKARVAHEAQMTKIEALINGKEVHNPTEVERTKCDFGKWLYNEDNRVKKILGAQFYETIDSLHAQWHMEYSRIFNLIFKEKKTSFFGAKKTEQMDIDKIKLYYSELIKTTEALLKILASSERRINALNDSKFL